MVKVPAPEAGEIAHEAALTPLFAGSLFTTAVTWNVLPASTEEPGTDSSTVMDGTVIVIEPVFVGSEAEVAVMVTVTSLAGGVAGAV